MLNFFVRCVSKCNTAEFQDILASHNSLHCARVKNCKLELETTRQGERAREWKTIRKEKLVRVGDLAPWVACFGYQTWQAVITVGCRSYLMCDMSQGCSIGSVLLHSC